MLGIPPLISSFTKKQTLTVYPISMSVYPLGVVWIYLTLTEMLQCKGSLDINSYDFRLSVYPLGETPDTKNWRLFGREKPEEKRDLEVSYCTIPSSLKNMVYINHSHHSGITIPYYGNTYIIFDLKLMEYKEYLKNHQRSSHFCGERIWDVHMGLSENRVLI